MKCTPETIWDLERRLSQPTFRGVPVGSALASMLFLEIYRGRKFTAVENAKNVARFFFHQLRPKAGPEADVSLCKGRVLVTWLSPSYRLRDLMFPVAKHLGYDRCMFLFRKAEMAQMLPRGVVGLGVDRATRYDVGVWRHDYRRFWDGFQPVVEDAVRQLALPRGVYGRLADAIVLCTQQIAGFLEFLHRAQPAAVLVEHDRDSMWASLVLCARTLGIPTFTMLHGMPGERCLNFYPLLADTLFCWGDMFADMFLAAGVEASRIRVTGCPRLTRELPISQGEARIRIGLDPDKPVALFATQNFASWDSRLKLAETFCQAIQASERFRGLVRLHPADTLSGYAELAARFSLVKFLVNEECDLDTVLAAADLAVVHSSGFGDDALIKRRLIVVLDAIDEPLGHGQRLVSLGGAPRATSPETLRDILHQLLFNEQEHCRHQQLAEQYTRRFCAFFGDEAAERTAEQISQKIGSDA